MFATIVLAASMALGACNLVEDNTPLCTPKKTRPCHCHDGAAGQQVCLDSGDDYDACNCSPDAGMGVAVDALTSAL
ncbi:MAG: hypothetical protein IPI49_20835 [Myxococcales bacterium]|nr:hypothetical protein [Myxococcales bacterium]